MTNMHVISLHFPYGSADVRENFHYNYVIASWSIFFRKPIVFHKNFPEGEFLLNQKTKGGETQFIPE